MMYKNELYTDIHPHFVYLESHIIYFIVNLSCKTMALTITSFHWVGYCYAYGYKFRFFSIQ